MHLERGRIRRCEIIRAERRRTGMSPASFAGALGVSEEDVEGWEALGASSPLYR